VLTDDLVRLYPRLHHVAEAGSWPAIRERGLLTSAQLCDLFEVPPEQAETLLRRRRATRAVLDHPVHGRAVLRDQKPLSETKLAGCLTDGTTARQWIAVLNGRVFFWLQENRLNRMLDAYGEQEHDVLTVDTAALLERHADRVRLSRINSGSTAPMAAPRGLGTFQAIGDYPHPPRTRPRANASDIAELCVLDGVPDLADAVVAAERRKGRTVLQDLL
jgi:hypothetical protein